MFRRPRPFCLALMALAVAGSILAVPTSRWGSDAGATGPGGSQVYSIPLRWCAMENTTVADSPGTFGEPDTDGVLWRRHERATDQIWTPGAGITFRSAITNQVMQNANFPKITDPSPPPPASRGQRGDVLDPDFGAAEYNEVRSRCESAWSTLSAQYGIPNVGLIAVSIRRFVDANGVPTNKWGKAVNGWTTQSMSDNVCTNPERITSINGAVLVVDPDPAITPGLGAGPNDARLVAHELGHVLMLGHGNGVDDNNNGVFDSDCDSAETNWTNPTTIMHGDTSIATTTITPQQRTRSRLAAQKTSGMQIDPPMVLLPSQTTSDLRSDPFADVAAPSVDMTGVRLTVNAQLNTIVFTHALFGVIPEEEFAEYMFYLDLDTDPTSGGLPSDLGFGTAFEGAEIVTRVEVRGFRATATVWVFEGGSFVEIEDERIFATIVPAIEAESGQMLFQEIALSVPADRMPPVRPTARLQAVTQQLGPGAESDVLPGGPGATPGPDSDNVYIVDPQFPVCTANPPQVFPGDAVTIEASGFERWSEPIHVILGDQLVAQDTLDAAGNATVGFVVPDDAAQGMRLITVGVDGTALTADCVLQVGEAETGEEVNAALGTPAADSNLGTPAP